MIVKTWGKRLFASGMPAGLLLAATMAHALEPGCCIKLWEETMRRGADPDVEFGYLCDASGCEDDLYFVDGGNAARLRIERKGPARVTLRSATRPGVAVTAVARLLAGDPSLQTYGLTVAGQPKTLSYKVDWVADNPSGEVVLKQAIDLAGEPYRAYQRDRAQYVLNAANDLNNPYIPRWYFSSAANGWENFYVSRLLMHAATRYRESDMLGFNPPLQFYGWRAIYTHSHRQIVLRGLHDWTVIDAKGGEVLRPGLTPVVAVSAKDVLAINQRAFQGAYGCVDKSLENGTADCPATAYMDFISHHVDATVFAAPVEASLGLPRSGTDAGPPLP